MNNSNEKIYKALELALSDRVDLKDTIISSTKDKVQKLRELDLEKEELVELKSCYESLFQDSMGSLHANLTIASIVFSVSASVFGSIFFNELFRVISESIPDRLVAITIHFIILLIFFAVLIFILVKGFRTDKISNDNARIRNYLTAASVLLAEKNRKSTENSDT